MLSADDFRYLKALARKHATDVDYPKGLMVKLEALEEHEPRRLRLLSECVRSWPRKQTTRELLMRLDDLTKAVLG